MKTNLSRQELTAVFYASGLGSDVSGLSPWEGTTEEFSESLASRLNDSNGRVCVINAPPVEVNRAEKVRMDERSELLLPAAPVLFRRPFDTWPELDDRLAALGGVQSNLPALWSTSQISGSGQCWRFDCAQVAVLDHAGFERFLVFDASEGKLLTSVGTGEWSRPVELPAGDAVFAVRFFLAEMAYDGQRIDVWHSSVCRLRPDAGDISLLERRLLSMAGPYFPISSEETSVRAAEQELETTWLVSAIHELSRSGGIHLALASVERFAPPGPDQRNRAGQAPGLAGLVAAVSPASPVQPQPLAVFVVTEAQVWEMTPHESVFRSAET